MIINYMTLLVQYLMKKFHLKKENKFILTFSKLNLILIILKNWKKLFHILVKQKKKNWQKKMREKKKLRKKQN